MNTISQEIFGSGYEIVDCFGDLSNVGNGSIDGIFLERCTEQRWRECRLVMVALTLSFWRCTHSKGAMSVSW